MDVKFFIHSLGQARAVAAKLAIKPRRVYGWVEKGTIPYKWRPQMAEMARELGIPVPPEIAAYAPGDAP